MSLMTQPWQPLSRNDRHVRRASLSLPAGVSEHRASFLVEEALRLMALPGEEQGRTYYFRRVTLRGLAAAAPPSEWIDRAQSTMHALAVRALHGTDIRAANADAVFFHSQQEALEWLLRRIFRAFPREVNAAEWFAPMIAPAGNGTGATMRLVAVIEQLRSLPSEWFAAATVLLDAVDADAAILTVLESIPERVLRAWLSELGGPSAGGAYAPRISDGRMRALRKRLAEHDRSALSYWASRDGDRGANPFAGESVRRELPVHLVWLAALAVAAEHASELVRGSALAGGRAILEELAESISQASAEYRRNSDMASALVAGEVLADSLGHEQPAAPGEHALGEGFEADDEVDANVDKGLERSPFTAAGGLYFLLNVLRQLGIETAINALPASYRSVFLARLIESLARAAAVAQGDPALLWATAALDEARQDEDLEGRISAASCWPRTLLATPDLELTTSRLIRAWTVAVRRWCWLNARLTLREIVSRPGQILLTCTDLDVTLSMDTVDVRLRRVGLDLDPGWLPWFGRVVRFHYVNGPIRGCDNGGQTV